MMRTDPADARGYLRWFYHGWRPTWLGRIWSRVAAYLSSLGLTSRNLVTLQIADRRTGRLGSTVLVRANCEGRFYVVSMLGNGAEWVQNARAANGKAFIKRRGGSPVQLTEIPPQERAPILKAWTQLATSGRQHLPIAYDAPLSAFEPICGDYPVFRLDPSVTPSSRAKSAGLDK